MPNRSHFLSIPLAISTKAEILQAVEAATPDDPALIATVNPEFMVEARKNPVFKQALGSMTHCTVDGSGLFFFLSLWNALTGQPKPKLYHGADLVNDLFSRYTKGDKRFFLVGGPPGLAEKARQAISQQFPGCVIAGAHDGGVIDANNVRLEPKLKELIDKTNPDIVLVGFGAPKQELWIQSAKEELRASVFIGVGGSFGFYTEKKRAPKPMRQLHLEWLYRGFSEPGHWKRLWKAVIVFSMLSAGWILANFFNAKAKG